MCETLHTDPCGILTVASPSAGFTQYSNHNTLKALDGKSIHVWKEGGLDGMLWQRGGGGG